MRSLKSFFLLHYTLQLFVLLVAGAQCPSQIFHGTLFTDGNKAVPHNSSSLTGATTLVRGMQYGNGMYNVTGSSGTSDLYKVFGSSGVCITSVPTISEIYAGSLYTPLFDFNFGRTVSAYGEWVEFAIPHYFVARSILIPNNFDSGPRNITLMGKLDNSMDFELIANFAQPQNTATTWRDLSNNNRQYKNFRIVVSSTTSNYQKVCMKNIQLKGDYYEW